MKRFLLLFICMTSLLMAHGQVYKPDQNGVLYVDSASTVNPADYNWIGDSWDKAIPQLADALQTADSLNGEKAGTVKQIWVARGTYKPLYSAEDGHRKEDGDRNNAFVLLEDVKIYGGFAGTETSLDDRDTTKLFSNNKTILDGHKMVHHVIIGSGEVGNAELNGFVVTGGNAKGGERVNVNGNTIQSLNGAGLYLYYSSPKITSCVISNNKATAGGYGGGIYNGKESAPVIDHCVFSNDSAIAGGAMYNDVNASPRVLNSLFSKNSAIPAGDREDAGGAIYNDQSYISLVNCRFIKNSAVYGAAMYNYAAGPSLTNCIFSNNNALENGGAVYSSSSFGSYFNCLLYNNKANQGGAFDLSGSSPKIFYCTITDNSAAKAYGGGSIHVTGTPKPEIRNAIIWGNSSDIAYNGYGPDILQYSLVQSDDVAGTTGHNLNEDPLFVDPSNNNYQLKLNSPVRDAGTSLSYGKMTDTDLAGNARIVGTSPDMGAYEVQSYMPDENRIFYVNKSVSGGNHSGESWTNAFKELSDALLFADQLNSAKPGTVKQIWVAKGTYSPYYSAEDGHRTKDGFEVQSDNGTVNSFSKNAFVLLSHVKVYGGFEGNETSLAERESDTVNIFNENKTVLDGNFPDPLNHIIVNSYHVVIAAKVDSAVLDGFVIENGYSSSSSGNTIVVNGQKVPKDDGGGLDIENSSVSLRNCLFKNNKASTSGGAINSYNSSFTIAESYFGFNNAGEKGGAIAIHNERSSEISVLNCTFDNNKTSKVGNGPEQLGGGAIYNESGSALRIINSNFIGNHTSTISYYENGGAIFNLNSSPTLSNCNFEENVSSYGGAIYNRESSADIEDCSFNGNKALYPTARGGAVYNSSYSDATIVNSTFTNNKSNEYGGAIMNNDNSSPKITGCLFYDNEALSSGHAIYNGNHSSPKIINSTISEYYPGNIHYSITNKTNCEPVIINSVVWGDDHSIWYEDNSSVDISYSVIQQDKGVYDGDGNLNKDPQFIDPQNGDFRLKTTSPAIAAGSQNVVQQYHLPDADLAGNPRVVDGKINMGAYGSSFVHPTGLTTAYDGKDTVNVSWQAPLQGDESYVDGDNFKLERSTDSTFQSNVKTVTSTIAYAPDKKNYSIEDDITDISGGLILYYRLTRTMAQNQDWQKPAYDTAVIRIDTLMKGISVDTMTNSEGNSVAVITWEPFVGVWPGGTQFSLIKKNKTDGTQQSISIEEDAARAGQYVDDNIPSCKKITYTISVKLGNHFASPPKADIPGHVLTKKLATITTLTASKGYYPDRTTLRWKTTGAYDHYVINRKVYGSSDAFEQAVSVDGNGLKSLKADDDKGTPGVYYQYAVTGLTQCSEVTLHSDTIKAIGFRSPTGTVYGRVTYDKGGGAVQDATVRMESKGQTKLGRSIHLDGQRGSGLVLDSLNTFPSDSAFTLSLWIKPEDKAPKDQIIFTREGQYTLGFDQKGRIYFGYYGTEVTTDYVSDTLNGWIHIAAVHQKDTLMLMVQANDSTIIARGDFHYKKDDYGSKRVYIGSNSDGFNFKGYIDEMRLWNRARDSLAIAKDYSRLLTGEEKGLIAYWRFDAAIKDQFYDLSHQGEQYNRNDGAMDSMHVTRSEVIPSVDQLALKAYTDSTGNYTITGIPYTGVNGTTYTIAPRLKNHHFDPVSVNRIFSSGSGTFTLDFKDKSSYSVSGTVTYANTNVPVAGVQFKIDGNYAYNGNGGIAQSDAAGTFTLSVPVGVHDVQAVKANHVFINDGRLLLNGRKINYQQNMAGVTVRDSTTVLLIGRIAGGTIQSNYPLGFSLSKNILGAKMSVTLTSQSQSFLNTSGSMITKYFSHLIDTESGETSPAQNASTKVEYDKDKIVIYPDTATGEFEAELIPASFIIDQEDGVQVQGYDKSPLSSAVNLDLSDSLITRKIVDSLNEDSVYHAGTNSWNYTTVYDTVKYNASYIFTYNVDPVVTVQQAMGPGNPNVFDYFGSQSYTFTNVLGEKTNIPAYNKDTRKYTFESPVFVQGNSYTFKVKSFQRFPYYDANGKEVDHTDVPSLGGKVIVHNELKTGASVPDVEALDSTGTAYYTFSTGGPELTGNRLKGYTVGVQIGNEVYQWKNGQKQNAYVFGGVADGTDFVTAGPDARIGVLRDPPGSESYAFLEQGSTFTRTIEHSYHFDSTGSAGGMLSFLPTVSASVGIGVISVSSTTSPILEGSAHYIREIHRDSSNSVTSSFTLTSNIKTSNDPSFDGAQDDIFIGYSTNITYGNSRTLCAVPFNTIRSTDSLVFPKNGETAKYAIVEREGQRFGQSFGTMFVYPQYYIEKYLIPNLEKIRNGILSKGKSYPDPQKVANNTNQEVYVSRWEPSDSEYYSYNEDPVMWGDKVAQGDDFSNGPSYDIYFPKNAQGEYTTPHTDTIMFLNQQIDSWKKWLSDNEKYKINTKYDENYSFGAGSSIDISKKVDTMFTHNENFKFIVGADWGAKAGLLINNVGAVATMEGKMTHSPKGKDTSGTITKDTATTIGFHLEENGSNYMSISVGKDPVGFPVYQTKGGVTSCPYEDSSVTKYYQPGTPLNQKTLQREMPEIKVKGKSVVTGIAANRQAVYTLELANASSVKGDIYFGLSVIDKSNPYGAKIYLDGTPLGNGRTLLIPSGETLTKTLTVEKGPDSMHYDNIEILLHSTCQYNPVVYSNNIADTVSVSAHFLPGCSDINLSAPKDKWLLNTLSLETVNGSDTIRYLPVTLDQYDLNKNLFNHIELQYKSASSSTWITKMNFFTDSANYRKDKQGGDKAVIQSADETDYKLLMNDLNFADGQYDIRALSVCMDNGKVVATTPSNTVSGIKDTYRPRPFGTPQPANGILGIGESPQIRFNEPIDIGYLNQQPKTTFFTVRGVKNGAAVDSLVSIKLDGQNDFVMTEFDKNLTGKDFTVAMWIMPDKKEGGTLFSQGNKNLSVELALTDDYHLQVKVGRKTFIGTKVLSYLPGQWVHVALVYHAQDGTVTGFYNYKEALKGTKAIDFEGIGPFIFGKSLYKDGDFFAGKIRNVRIWTEALSAIKLQKNAGKLLSGGENHLLACYPMSEGKGNVLFDKAHGDNGTFTGEWKTPEGRSVSFDGKGYVKLNTSQAVITSEMDFTIGLWFKGGPGQKNATLISNGKGNGKDLGGSEDLYSLGFENGKLTFDNNDYKVQIEGDYLDNNWHHVVIAANRNRGTAQFYVDGTMKKFFDAGNLGGLVSTFTYLGARAYREAPDSTITHFDRYFKGNIDEVRIWDTYLNSTLVTKEGNTGLTGKETGLLAYYPFDVHSLDKNSNIWFTKFTPADRKIQNDPNNLIPDAVLTAAKESNEKAPVKNPGPKQDLRFDFVSNNDAIIFTFTGGMEEMKAIDKSILTFTASNIKDKHGNYMASPVTWTAYIDQNPLSWSDETLQLSKGVDKPLQFTSYIVNSSGREESFNINNLSPWLTTDIISGTVAPEGKQKIIFTVNKGLNVGTYDDIVEMTNSLQETQGLALDLQVIGHTPDWKVNPADFKYNMSLYGKIRIDGIFSDDKADMLAAFINGKCVGVTHNTYFENSDLWYALLTLYSDSVQHDQVEFRIWDASTGKVYAGIPSASVSFQSDTILGSPRDPVIFDGKEMLFQNIKLNKGWNWISFDLANAQLKNVNATLINGNWLSGDIVKHDLRGFDGFSVHKGWLGTLPGFDNTSLFKLKTAKEQTLSTNGTALDLKETPIWIKGYQWNYISYLPQVNLTLKEALADYKASEGDVIKSQTGFSMYDPRLGWVGNLTYLEPDKGYMLYRKAKSDVQFIYPEIRGSLANHRLAKNPREQARLNPYQLPIKSNYQFADNMTLIAEVAKGFKLLPEDKIVAYIGNRKRGKAQAIRDPATNQYAFFFNISGKQRQSVYFSIKRNDQVVARTKPVLSYMPNSRVGSLREPFMLHFVKINEYDENTGVQLFPNPFTDQINVYMHLKESRTPSAHTVQLSVWNEEGQLIFIRSEKQIDNGYYHTTWNGKNAAGRDCVPGIYFIHITVDKQSTAYKVMKY